VRRFKRDSGNFRENRSNLNILTLPKKFGRNALIATEDERFMSIQVLRNN
jgi:hypothetical protein